MVEQKLKRLSHSETTQRKEGFTMSVLVAEGTVVAIFIFLK